MNSTREDSFVSSFRSLKELNLGPFQRLSFPQPHPTRLHTPRNHKSWRAFPGGTPACEEAKQGRGSCGSGVRRESQAWPPGRRGPTNGLALWKIQQCTFQSSCLGGAHHQLQEVPCPKLFISWICANNLLSMCPITSLG